MDGTLTSRMQIKLFLGFSLGQELKRVLYQREEAKPFVTIPHEGGHYIGLFLEGEKHSVDQIKLEAMAMRQTFHEHYPESKQLELSLHIFPQLFVR